jgi:hypothetical protein
VALAKYRAPDDAVNPIISKYGRHVVHGNHIERLIAHIRGPISTCETDVDEVEIELGPVPVPSDGADIRIFRACAASGDNTASSRIEDHSEQSSTVQSHIYENPAVDERERQKVRQVLGRIERP